MWPFTLMDSDDACAMHVTNPGSTSTITEEGAKVHAVHMISTSSSAASPKLFH